MSGQSSQPDFPYRVATEDLSEQEAIECAAENSVVDLVPVIDFQVIKSPQTSSYDQQPVIDGAAWGIDAVGALHAPNKGEGVTVAVLDTGIDLAHPAFSGVDFTLSDFTLDECGKAGVAEDRHGHGTHVAAKIFGRDVEGVRIGVAPGVSRVLIGKVVSNRGANFVALKSALDWAINNKADIVCLSLGVDFRGILERFQEELRLPEDIAVSRVLEAYRKTMKLLDTYAASVKAFAEHKRGALLVAASGNESRRDESPAYTVNSSPPAAAEGVISVGAVRLHGGTLSVAPFSNSGAHLVAPGVSIMSARMGGGLITESGTSMAAPHVAGVAALWIAHEFQGGRSARWIDRIRTRLEGTAKKVAGSFPDVGNGLIQAPPPA